MPVDLSTSRLGRFPRLPSRGPVHIDRDAGFLRRSRSWREGTHDARARAILLDDGRIRGHGTGHLVHALHRDARLQPSGRGLLRLADGVASLVCGDARIGHRAVRREPQTHGHSPYVVGGIFMGIGIAGMHYIGMEAMRLPAMCHYSAGLVVLSVVLAIVISLVALWLTFQLRDETAGIGWRKLAGAAADGHGDSRHALHRHGRGHFHADGR